MALMRKLISLVFCGVVLLLAAALMVSIPLSVVSETQVDAAEKNANLPNELTFQEEDEDDDDDADVNTLTPTDNDGVDTPTPTPTDNDGVDTPTPTPPTPSPATPPTPSTQNDTEESGS